MASTLTVAGAVNAIAGGPLSYAPPQLVNNTNCGQAAEYALTSTPILITLPPGSQWFGVTPPNGNTVALSHKWVVGDTGGKMHMAYGIPCLAVDAANLTFYLWAASAVTVMVWSA